MTSSDFYKLLIQKFPFDPTTKQCIALEQLSQFVYDDTPNVLYLLKGFAGTGKTSIIGTLVSNLWETKKSLFSEER
jgi:RecG-like helicase